MRRFIAVMVGMMIAVMYSFSAFASTNTLTTSSTIQMDDERKEITDFELIENQLRILLQSRDSNDGEFYDFENADFINKYVKYYCGIILKDQAKEYNGIGGLSVKLTEEELLEIVNGLKGDYVYVTEDMAEKIDNNYYVNVDEVTNDYEVTYVSFTDNGNIENNEYTFEYINRKTNEEGFVVVNAAEYKDNYVVSSIIDVQANVQDQENEGNTQNNNSSVIILLNSVSENTIAYASATAVNNTENTNIFYTDETSLQQNSVQPRVLSSVASSTWNLTGVNVTSQSEYVVGDTVTFSPKTTGTTTGVQYKYVYSIDNWKTWGVVKSFSTATSASLKLNTAGKYDLYIDATYGGKTVTKYVTINVVTAQDAWNLTGVNVTSKTLYKAGDTVTITPAVTGRTTGVKYKYVYSDNDWSRWGVIKPFSTSTSVSFKFDSAGKYDLYIDAQYGSRTVTKCVTINVVGANDTWDLSGVSATSQSVYYTGDTITFKPIVVGDTTNVQYKYVFSKDNWKNWGVIKAYGNSASANITFTSPGKYDLYIDAKQGSRIVTKYCTINVTSEWNHDGGTISGTTPYRVGQAATITAKTSGSDYGAKYKFVYEYNNWKNWGVIQSLSSKSSTTFIPPYNGTCNIYIDITCNGITKTKKLSMNVLRKWSHNGVTISESPIYKVNTGVTIKASTLGNSSGLKYKYVYSKDDWTEWGVIETSSATSVKFTPKSSGVYDFYVDISDSTGYVETKSVQIIVSNYGWAIGSHTFSKASPVTEGTSVTMSYTVKGYNLSGIKYKFVAHNTTTDTWFILSPMTAGKNSYTWTPSQPGAYNIYMESEDERGNLDQKIVPYVVSSKYTSSVKVSLSNTSASIPQGKSLYLKKTSVSPSSSTIKFVSDNSNVATVETNTGYVYAKSEGTTEIKAVDSSGKTAASCVVTVTASEPIRFAYTSPNCAPKGSTVSMYATTDTTRTAVRFLVNGTYYSATKYATESNTYVWRATISGLSAGTTAVKAESFKNGAWSTCDNGATTIFVTNTSCTTVTTCETRRMSDNGVQFLCEMEGFSASVYNDAGGTPTLGYGNVIYGGEQFYDNYTKREALAEMLNLINMEGYSVQVNKMLVDNGIKFNQQQFDALVSFSYNKGYSWATQWYADTYPEKATLRNLVLASTNKDLNNIDKQAFIKEFNSNHHVATTGQCLEGLLNRRINELEMFFDGDYVRKMPPTGSKYYDTIQNCPNY